MKRLLLIFMLLSCYLRASEIFLLPDHTTDALHTINSLVKKSQHEILIISSSLQSKKLERSLKKLAHSGISITLILGKKNAFSASSLQQYQSVEIKTLNGLQSDKEQGKLSTTLIIVDKREACLSSVTLNEDAMRHDIGFVECSSDPQRLKTYLRHAQTLKERAKSYLSN